MQGRCTLSAGEEESSDAHGEKTQGGWAGEAEAKRVTEQSKKNSKKKHKPWQRAIIGI